MIPIPPELMGVAGFGLSVSGFKPSVALNDLRAMCDGNEMLSELLDTVIASALRYAETVCRFQQIVAKQGQAFDDQGVKAEIEAVRGSAHTAFITDVNVLARMMRKSQKDASWCDRLNGERARYGRLSLTLSFEYLLTQKVA